MLISVVLPEPDGPMMAIHSPASTSKLTRSSARTSPKRFSSCSTWTSGAIILLAKFPPDARAPAGAAEKLRPAPRRSSTRTVIGKTSKRAEMTTPKMRSPIHRARTTPIKKPSRPPSAPSVPASARNKRMIRGTVPPSAFIRPTSRPPLHRQRRHRRQHAEHRENQNQRDGPENQTVNPPQNRSLGGGDLTHGPHIEPGQIVRKLARNCLDFRGRAGNAQLHQAHAAGKSRKGLRRIQVREDLIILGAAGGNDSRDREGNVAIAGTQLNRAAGRESELARGGEDRRGNARGRRAKRPSRLRASTRNSFWRPGQTRCPPESPAAMPEFAAT